MSDQTPHQSAPRPPRTRKEIAARAQEDPAFRDGLLAAAELVRTLAEGKINV